MNVYSFTGRLARDCEQRFTQGGMAICSFSVAVDYGFGENKGTNWLRASLFGKRAEGGLPKYLTKGTQVAITGELRIREYDDKEGVKRTSVEVSVDKLDLIGGRNEGGQSSGGGYQQSGGQQAPAKNDPFADSPDFGSVPVDDDIPF
ncbi:MAG: single-stranded DNA-binding protein [Mariprofundaceae bacterium]